VTDSIAAMTANHGHLSIFDLPVGLILVPKLSNRLDGLKHAFHVAL